METTCEGLQKLRNVKRSIQRKIAHFKMVGFSFFICRGGQQSDCPHKTLNSCNWKPNDGQDSFRPDMLYYMVIIVRNNKTGNETKSKIFHEQTNKIGRYTWYIVVLIFMPPLLGEGSI